MPQPRYDYIVIGGGSAGCVVASRLSEDPDVRVLLLEAGGNDRHFWIRIPLGFQGLKTDPNFNWGFETVPETELNGRRIELPRGKVIGGSSTTNGMIYCRAHPSDYDHWRQLGLAGWSYADVLPYFKRAEGHVDGENEYHGGSGPLTVSKGDRTSEIHIAHLTAGKAAGHPLTPDHNAELPEGFGPGDFTIRRGRRASTSRVYLRPAMRRKNLTVITGARASRILFDRRRAIGVAYQGYGRTETVHADREVIVSGGTYLSPHLLMLSGVGPADHLREHGIPLIHDAPQVGRNLQDHVHVGAIYKTHDGYSSDGMLRADRLAFNVLRWQFLYQGPLTIMPVAAIGYMRTREGLARPDVEMLMGWIPLDARVWFPGIRASRGGHFTCRVALLRPESRGTVTLRSADVDDKPAIHHNFLSAHNDIVALRGAIAAARKVYAQEPLRGMIKEELQPGKSVQSEAELDAYIRADVNTLYHPVGTCRMGTDPEAVLDNELRVNGVEGLRVVDASVMPTLVGGHTNAPTIMIAEKASDMIQGRKGLAA